MSADQELIDWSICTRLGARRAQLREYLKLSVRERLEAVEQMGRVGEMLKQAVRCSPRHSAIASVDTSVKDD